MSVRSQKVLAQSIPTHVIGGKQLECIPFSRLFGRDRQSDRWIV